MRDLNATLLVLIPKIQGPETIHNFRPISLCNVTYKLVAKTLVIKIRHLIVPNLIAPTQVSFVLGRQIHDNIVITQEIIHSM